MHDFDSGRAAPGRRERLPAHAPLGTVLESFLSHGSSLSKYIPSGSVPAIVGRSSDCLGNTQLQPPDVATHFHPVNELPVCRLAGGRTNGLLHRHLLFLLRGFNGFFCQERPDRRGHIRNITSRPWLLRSSPCCSRSPALQFG